jgi:hypothetical protein
MNKSLFLVVLIFSTCSLFAQKLFMPRNIATAYERGTRSHSGAPGEKYWQNKASYDIKVKVTPKTNLLQGSEKVVYTNDSPDSLKILAIKINQDLYRKGGQRASDLTATDIIDGGVSITKLLVNGKMVAADKQNRAQTILTIKLDQAIPPGAITNLEIDWSFTMPKGTDSPRICVCDATTFFTAYWYPQIAVYDDLHGWNTTPYTGLQEFYNDFNDYQVEITVPKNMMVWATGMLQNPEQLFNPNYLERYKRAQKTSEIVQIFTPTELSKGLVFQKAKSHTFKYKAMGVPDFAFAGSDHYFWDATMLQLDSKPPVSTFISAAYHTDSKDYPAVAQITYDGIQLMSTYLPGYGFPYPSMTVFNGDDGMEYPMMCNDDSTWPNPATGLTVHEVSHTYFPFMMGINEQMYAWMDEGWASFFDYMLTDTLKGKHGGKANIRGYGSSAGNEWDVPPMVQSRFLSSPAYRTASYVRPQAAYLTLYDLLGHEKFQKSMRLYMDRWKGKHPAPFDFFNTWSEGAEQDLNWFWKPWFFDWGYPDLAMGTVNAAAKTPSFQVKRIGNIPVPIHAEIVYTDGTSEILHKTAEVWKTGAESVEMMGTAGKTIKAVFLGSATIPDVNTKDNAFGAR